MSGELQVVFIYDTLRCRKEEDDPSDAILYFHPQEISEARRIAICGQLMGITQFLVDMFSKPKILSLENGKFALKELGKQYILALGCSSVTPDWLLEKQATILYQITKFFHKDIDNILMEVGEDRNLLATKLTSIMEHYIPISQHHGDLFALAFGILPILNLPKSANHISLSATLLLQTCRLRTEFWEELLCFKTMIAVEIIQELARKLAFIQPYHLPPADSAKTNFILPPGVQLLKVYLTKRDLIEIKNHSSSYQYPPKNGKVATGSKKHIDVIREEEDSSETFSSPEQYNSSKTTKTQSPEVITLKTDEISSSSNLLHSQQRLFRSLENLTIHHQTEENSLLKVKPADLKTFSTSLTDPFFPYLKSDGKNISKFYFDAYAYPNPDEDENQLFISSEPSKSNQNEGAAKSDDNKSSTTTSEEEDKSQQQISLNLSIPKSTGISRPKDLALNSSSSSSRLKTRRRWSNFEDMMSPVLELPPASIEMENFREKSASISVTDTGFMNTLGNPDQANDYSYKEALLNTFRKLPSMDELSESEKANRRAMYNNIDNKTNNKYVLSPEIPPYRPWAPFKGPSESKKSICTDSEVYEEEALLFIYSLGGMRLLLLLEKTCSNNRELIQNLRDYGSNSIAELEVFCCSVEEQSMSMGSGHHDNYCYLQYENVWRSLSHGGRLPMDFEIVSIMSNDFHMNPNINELIIRGDDHVVYGYQCVGSEVFYQQQASLQPMPMPGDIMGKLPIKAKRRLERDHNILLL